jgi:hypothetical protein
VGSSEAEVEFIVVVDRQEISLEVSAGAPDVSEGDLQVQGLVDGVGVEQVVDGLIGGEERESVGGFEPFLGKGAGLAHAVDAQGGLVNELQSQARFDPLSGLSGASEEEVPGSQAKVLGDKKPDAE